MLKVFRLVCALIPKLINRVSTISQDSEASGSSGRRGGHHPHLGGLRNIVTIMPRPISARAFASPVGADFAPGTPRFSTNQNSFLPAQAKAATPKAPNTATAEAAAFWRAARPATAIATR